MANNKDKPLYRLPRQGQIFGVCAGLADYFEIDVTLMRVIFVVLAFMTGGAVVILYIILAIVLPVDPDQANATIGEKTNELGHELRNKKTVGRLRNYFGVGLLLLGIWLLLGQLFPQWFDLRWDLIWPILLVLAGFSIINQKE